MITGGFGMTMDLERGTMRQWVMGRDGVKRWADTNEPIADFARVTPTISMRKVRDAGGGYGVELTLTGLTSEKQVEAAMLHMQRLFCGGEISEQ